METIIVDTVAAHLRLSSWVISGRAALICWWRNMVRLSRIAKEEQPSRPFILMGHSMGSFAAQQ